jgi:hypothetical protein
LAVPFGKENDLPTPILDYRSGAVPVSSIGRDGCFLFCMEERLMNDPELKRRIEIFKGNKHFPENVIEDDHTIRFIIDGSFIEVCITVGAGIRVASRKALAIRPGASNEIFVRVEK